MPFQRKKVPEQKNNDRIVFKKVCKYIGSVAVTLLNGEERQHFVNEKLLEMKDLAKGIPVVLMITDEGIKVLKENESAVKMAHGITCIAFSTCQPERKLFAYVAKINSRDKDPIIQAHMFKTKKNVHSQQLSLNLSKSFKMAYAKDTVRRKNRVKLFEAEAKEQQAASEIQNRGKRWAKAELAHGHEHSGHAMHAKGHHGSKLMAGLDINDTPTLSIRNDLDIRHGFENNLDKVEVKSCVGKNRENTEQNIFNQKCSDGGAPVSKHSCSDVHDARSVPTIISWEQEISDGKKKELKRISQGQGTLESIDITLKCDYSEDSVKKTEFVTPATKFSGNIVNLQSYENVVLDEYGYHISDDVFDEEVTQPLGRLHQNTENTTNVCSKPHIRMDVTRFTMSEEELLKDSEWFQPGFSREIAETVLQNRSIGSFFIRESSTHLDSFVMTVKVPTHMKQMGVANYLIKRLEDGAFRIKGFSSTFTTLTDLVAHYGTVQEDIPCQLRLASDNPLFLRQQHIDQPDGFDKNRNKFQDFDSDEYEDPDYENFNCNDDIMRELAFLRS